MFLGIFNLDLARGNKEEINFYNHFQKIYSQNESKQFIKFIFSNIYINEKKKK